MQVTVWRKWLRDNGYHRAARFDELLEIASDKARWLIPPRHWRYTEAYLSPQEYLELVNCRYSDEWMIDKIRQCKQEMEG